VPFYGQGMNAAFEDCVVLDECLKQSSDAGTALREYYARRKSNTDALADLAVQNFIEMRDKTASRVFRARKKLDHALEAMLPSVYQPLYGMVTFSRTPYAEAQRRAKAQDRVVLISLTAIATIVLAGIITLMIRLIR
jgi:kynurenine 3-monooxygenase